MNKIVIDKNNDTKVESLILSHGDLDGICSGVQFEHTFNANNMTYMAIYNMATGTGTTDYMYYDNVNRLKDGGVIFVLDRTFFSYEKSLKLAKDHNHKIIYIDHHIINESEEKMIQLAKSRGLFIVNMSGPHSHSAAYRVWEHLNPESDKDRIFELIKGVSDWDTFNWKELSPEKQVFPKSLKAWEALSQMTSIHDTMINIMSRDMTMDEAKDKIKSFKFIYDENCEALFDFINDNQVGFQLLNTKIPGVVSLTGYILTNKDLEYKFLSDVADMLINNPIGEMVDFVIWTDMDTISIRTTNRIDLKANIMADEIAKIFNGTGGGHPNAAGGKIKDKISMETLHKVISLMAF